MRVACWVVIGLCWMITSAPVAAQSAALTGQVTDAATGEPLVGANVFLDGTMRGAATGADGTFRIEGVSPGAYRLVASMVGYRAARREVTVAGTGTQPFSFALQAVPIEMGGVTVEGRRDEWLDHLDRFKRHFLGEGRHADDCEILNPEVLSFTVDEEKDVLRAIAEAPLQIVNRALGYEITYVLQRFNVRGTRISEESYGRFRAMTAESEPQRQAWDEARERAYRGSFQHFIRVLADSSVEEEGFRVYTTAARTYYYGPNPQFRIDGVEPVDHVRQITAPAVQPTQLMLRFPANLLRVEYVREQEDHAYLQTQLNPETRRASNKQLSWIALPNRRALVDVRSGRSVRPFAPVLFGYWGWQERVANALPREYEPGTAP